MKGHITPVTIANTVRMGTRSRRPKAVFLASDETDIALMNSVAEQRRCRVIPAHNRENAAKALEILVQDGWEGIVTIVDARYDLVDDQTNLKTDISPVDDISIEGQWDDLRASGVNLTGHRVRVTLIDDIPFGSSVSSQPNSAMLDALKKIADLTKNMNPKSNSADYLREAREGAMYGYDDE